MTSAEKRFSGPAPKALAPRDALTIARILKVNHAGEAGASRIDRAQIAVARWLYPELVAPLSEMLGHEIDHCAKFRKAMPGRQSRPCRAMWLWSTGGSVLGLCTALMGRQMIWTCTAAVESTVHRHLDDQLHFLVDRDPELHGTIQSIRAEELAHLTLAEGHIQGRQSLGPAVRKAIAATTEAVIWLATWGDSTRMARDLAAIAAAEARHVR